jgi:hypothetical protein
MRKLQKYFAACKCFVLQLFREIAGPLPQANRCEAVVFSAHSVDGFLILVSADRRKVSDHELAF